MQEELGKKQPLLLFEVLLAALRGPKYAVHAAANRLGAGSSPGS